MSNDVLYYCTCKEWVADSVVLDKETDQVFHVWCGGLMPPPTIEPELEFPDVY